MEMKEFIEKFQEQLEDQNTDISASTDFIKSDFWDSLTAMVIKVMIEDEYGVDIPVENLENFASIQELYDYIIEDRNG